MYTIHRKLINIVRIILVLIWTVYKNVYIIKIKITITSYDFNLSLDFEFLIKLKFGHNT